MKSYARKVVIEQDSMEDGRVADSAYCPVLKGCNTWGKSYEEALAKIREAVQLHVESFLTHGQTVPVDPENGVVELSSPSVLVNI